MVKYTEEKVVAMIMSDYQGRKYIFSPLVRNRKGHHREFLADATQGDTCYSCRWRVKS